MTDDPEKRIIQAGAAMGETGNVDYWEDIIALLMIQNGVNLTNPVSERSESVIDFYTSYVTSKDKTWDSSQPSSVLAFAKGRLAMLIAPSRSANEIREINPDLRFITVPVPQIPKSEPDIPDITYATYWFEGVWSRSVNSDIAWKFLKFMAESENLLAMAEIYQQKGKFPEVFPRRDMGILLKDDPVIGSVVLLSENAKSWYLAGNTNDGEKGINSMLAKAFSLGLEKALQTTGSKDVMLPVSEEVILILTSFEIKQQKGVVSY